MNEDVFGSEISRINRTVSRLEDCTVCFNKLSEYCMAFFSWKILTPNELRLLRLRCIATKRSMSSSDCAGHSGVDGAIGAAGGDLGGGVAVSLF